MDGREKKLISAFAAALGILALAGGLGQAQAPAYVDALVPEDRSRLWLAQGVVPPPLYAVSDATVMQVAQDTCACGADFLALGDIRRRGIQIAGRVTNEL